MTTVQLEGVALDTHDESYLFEYDPYGHQIRLQNLFEDHQSFVAVNDSPTGGGKTSSWLEPSLAHQLDTVAIYPTNALVEDQSLGIDDALEVVDHDVAILKVTADSLSSKRAEYGVTSNAKVIDRWVREHRGEQILFLTNPDIFVMMCRDLYAHPSRSFKQFELAVVDEFHRAGLKEKNTLRYVLDEQLERDNSRLERVVFLSATPDERQEATFERAMTAPYHRITESLASERRSFSNRPSDGWRSVMPPVDLDLRAAPTFGTASVLLDEDRESTLDFCRGGRTVLMLDGIHEVKRVYEWLDNELDRKVERIDGFHSENKREKLEQPGGFDVLVSNSAVEVGIDFDVDRIIFAGHNGGSFLQRLGRLRTEEQRQPARCYVPVTVKRELADLDGKPVTREELRERLDTVYPDPRQPETFGWRYSASEAFDHLRDRLRHTTTEQDEAVKNEGIERIHRHFLAEHGLSFGDVERVIDTINWQVLRDLKWYRGDSLQVLVWDTTEQRLRTYSLFYLLRYADIEFHRRPDFDRRVSERWADEVDRSARYVDGFCTYHGAIDTDEEGYGRDVAFDGGTLAGWIAQTRDAGRKPDVKDGITVTVDAGTVKPVRNNSVSILNERLKRRSDRVGSADSEDGGLLCFPVSGTTSVIKETYGLGDFFFLYPIAPPASEQYSLALGTDALYLHCHVQERHDRSNLENL